MKSQHSQGPWEIAEHNWSHTGIYADDHRVAMCDCDDATEDNQEELESLMKANATLIAAAPELLSALKGLMKAYEGSIPDHCNADWFEDYRAAQAAVSKALGES